MGTILQYVSGVFNVLKKDFPHLPLWKEDLVSTGNSRELVPRWYRTIRDNSNRIVCHRLIENGEKIQSKSEPIGRNLLKQLSLALLIRGDTDSVAMATNFVWEYSTCGT